MLDRGGTGCRKWEKTQNQSGGAFLQRGIPSLLARVPQGGECSVCVFIIIGEESLSTEASKANPFFPVSDR